MSIKDLTHDRLVSIRKDVEQFLVDFDELCKQRATNAYSPFATSRGVLSAREDALLHPSIYYSFRYFNSTFEIRRIGKSELYCVHVQGYPFTDFELKELREKYVEISFKFESYRIGRLLWSDALRCFADVVRIFFFDHVSHQFKQLELL